MELSSDEMQILNFTEPNWEEICTPINTQALARLLSESNYDKGASEYLIEGFSHGFDIGYRGPAERKDESSNLPFRVGNPTELWNKVMKEVETGHYAGPFTTPPNGVLCSVTHWAGT